MQLSDLLKPENVVCDSTEITSKKQVLERIGHMACHQDKNTNYVEVLQALLQRERLGSTVIGHGVAIPHARVKNLNQMIICLITLNKAINFYEDEKVAVDVIFSILAPQDADAEQLNILSELASALQTKAYRDALRQAATNEDLYQAAIQTPPTQGPNDGAEKNTHN